jgi:hypothetical protein
LRRDLNNNWEWVVRSSQNSNVGESRQSAPADVEKLINNYSATASNVGQATQSAEPGTDLELLKFEMTGTTSVAGQSKPASQQASESITVTIHEGPPGK